MKNTRICLIIISLLLLFGISVSLTGCVHEVKAQNLMNGITPNEINIEGELTVTDSDIADFAVRLFKASENNSKNTLISPLSVLYALAMTVNGAEGETLDEMESVLGVDRDELNIYLYSYMDAMPQSKQCKLSLANSIWFTDDDRFTVNRDFLQINADYYGAGMYQAPFDSTTLKDINNWVNEKTDGMIPEILDEIPSDAVMYLINALAFDAEWSDKYEKQDVKDGKFTTEDGAVQDAKYMYGSESFYIEDGLASGFIKQYCSSKFAFAALLPNEEVTLSEYIASLNGESLQELLTNKNYATVYTAIPKFETEYDIEMSEILRNMGMNSAFNALTAEFGGLGTSSAGNIYISRVLHKTYISVAEKGTKAGAATVVELEDMASAESPEQTKEIYLDRPFVYMLIDCERNIPLFIGTMMDIEK